MTKQQNQWEAMVSGQWFMPGTPETTSEQVRGFKLAKQLNDLGNTDPEKAREVIAKLIHPDSGSTMIHAPLNIVFGTNLRCCEIVFINFYTTILDQEPFYLGDYFMIVHNFSHILY